jgi:transcriptional regulator GlxA family with amidase domain
MTTNEPARHTDVAYSTPVANAIGGGAMALPLSKYHFLRSFKAFTGVTPARYLNGLRVERAQQILRQQSDVPLSDLARLVGFSEPAALSRAFQRLVGVRPGGYRAALRD